METIKAYSDIVVKYLLGREETKDSLLAFINAVLSDSGFEKIASVTIKNPFSVKEFETDKYCILDIKAEDIHGRLYDIEIQSVGNRAYINRTLYYWAKLYSSQIQEAQHYTKLKPVICINLINFTLMHSSDTYHTCYWISEKNNSELVLSDHLMIHFLELEKIPANKLFTDLEGWMQYFIHEGDDTMEIVLKDRPELEKVHNEYKKFTANQKMRDLYEARLKKQLDHNQMVYDAEQTGLERGMEKGIQKGMEQGEQHKAIETARNLLAEGINVKLIARATGLTEQQVNDLNT